MRRLGDGRVIEVGGPSATMAVDAAMQAAGSAMSAAASEADALASAIAALQSATNAAASEANVNAQVPFFNIRVEPRDPLLADIPAGRWVVWFNTASEDTALWANYGGELRKFGSKDTIPVRLALRVDDGTATVGQTSAELVYTPGTLLAFLNGANITEELVQTSGTSVSWGATNALQAGDRLLITGFITGKPKDGSVPVRKTYRVADGTASIGQRVFAVSYTPGTLQVFLNGISVTHRVTQASGDSFDLGAALALSEATDEVFAIGYAPGLIVPKSEHATSDHAKFTFGDWLFVNDATGAGYNNLRIESITSGTAVLQINPDGAVFINVPGVGLKQFT